MAAPEKHAFLTASGSARWLNCTASPHFEAGFPSGASVYAEEGSLAHRICEIYVDYNSGVITKRKFNFQLKKIREDGLYQEEMLKTAEFYAHYIYETSMEHFKKKPYLATEVRVDFSRYVPEGFGTCDCVMIGEETLLIIDYKHGKGVPVSAENNSQMRLYALGALDKYAPIFGEAIKTVSMAIVQPRITEDVKPETITVTELREWGESIKPIASEAFNGPGTFHTGPWCRFCKGRAACRARAENYTALEDFKNAVPEGRMTSDDAAKARIIGLPAVLTDEEIADLLIRGEELVSWYNDLKDYALTAILEGRLIPGWKAVEGRSVREFDNIDDAFEIMKSAGYDEALLYDRKPKTLAQLEKMIGKKDFAEMMGAHIVKPAGKPTLANAADKRDAYQPAVSDFGGVVNG